MNTLSRKPYYSFKEKNNTGLENLPLNALIFIKDENSLFILNDVTGIDDTITIEQAILNGNLSPLNFGGKKPEEFMPNPFNLPYTKAGEPGFEQIPAYIDYEGSSFVVYSKTACQPGNNGHLYLYQLRTNGDKQGIYMAKMNPDLSEYPIFDATEYRPPFLLDKEEIDRMMSVGYPFGGMAVRINNKENPSDPNYPKYYWIFFNNNPNPITHTFKDVTPILTNLINYSTAIYYYVPETDGFVFINLLDFDVESLKRPKITITDYDGNILAEAEGYKFGKDGGDFEYEATTQYVAARGFSKDGFLATFRQNENGKIIFKGHQKISVARSTGPLYAYIIHTFEFDPSTSLLTRTDPPGGIPTGGWPINPDPLCVNDVVKLKSALNVEYDGWSVAHAFNNSYIFDIVNKNGFFYIKKNVLLDEAFENDFYMYSNCLNNNDTSPCQGSEDPYALNVDVIKKVLPPDNSVIGKSILQGRNVRFSDGDWSLVISQYLDKSTNSLKRADAAVKGTQIEGGVVNYKAPISIEEISLNPNHTSFTEGNFTNIVYDTFDNGTNFDIKYYNEMAQLKTDTPFNTLTFNKNESIYNGYIEESATNEGFNPSTIYQKIYKLFPLAQSNFAVLYFGYSFKYPDYSTDVRIGFTIVDMNTGERKDALTITDSVDNSNDHSGYFTYLDESDYETGFISVYESTTDNAFYVWVHYAWLFELRARYYAVRPIKIDLTTGQVLSYLNKTLTLYANTGAQLGVHPELGFYITVSNTSNYYYISSFLKHNAAASGDIISTWDSETNPPNAPLEKIVSMRSTVGLQITFNEFPVILNGYYFKMPFKVITDLEQYSLYYVYIYFTNGMPDYLLRKTYTPTNTELIYLGYVVTDNIGIVDSNIPSGGKYLNIGNSLIINNGEIIGQNSTVQSIEGSSPRTLTTREYIDQFIIEFFDAEGDGSTTTFAIDGQVYDGYNGMTYKRAQVFLDGILQRPDIDYTISYNINTDKTEFTFNVAPAAGVWIRINYYKKVISAEILMPEVPAIPPQTV